MLTAGLGAKRIQELLLAGKSYSALRGQIIQSSDESLKFSFLKSGYVKRYLISNDGSLGIQIIYGPGDIFPLTLMYKVLLDLTMYEGPEVFHYEVMADAKIFTIETTDLVNAVQEDPLLYKDLLAVAGRHLQACVSSLENVTLPNFYKRVAHKLAYFARQFGKETSGGTKICIPLTQQDVANVLSATRETVSVCMIQLRRKKLIQVGSKHIIVPDIQMLEQEAYS